MGNYERSTPNQSSHGTQCNQRDNHSQHKTRPHREDEGDEPGEAGADLLLGEELALLHEQVLEALHLLADDAALLEHAQDLVGAELLQSMRTRLRNKNNLKHICTQKD